MIYEIIKCKIKYFYLKQNIETLCTNKISKIY